MILYGMIAHKIQNQYAKAVTPSGQANKLLKEQRHA